MVASHFLHFMPAHNKKTYEKMKAEGRCPDCGQKVEEGGGVLCKECREKRNLETRLRKKQAKSLGICPRCMKNPIYVGENACPDCMKKARDNYQDHKETILEQGRGYWKKAKEHDEANGICIWCRKRKATPGYKSCAFCRPKHNKKRKYDIHPAERPSYGLCYRCGEPVVPGKRLCKKHYDMCLAVLKKPTNTENHVWNKDEKARHEKIRSKYQR